MTRLLLVLVCALFMFVILTNVAPDLIPDVLKRHQAAIVPSAPSDPIVAKGKSKASLKRVAAKRETVSAEPAIPSATEVLPEEAPAILAPTRSPRPVFSVSAEQADLYITNSESGPPISVLTNGEVVEPQYVINTAGQEWTYVNVSDKKISGFVRSEDLARK